MSGKDENVAPVRRLKKRRGAKIIPKTERTPEAEPVQGSSPEETPAEVKAPGKELPAEEKTPDETAKPAKTAKGQHPALKAFLFLLLKLGIAALVLWLALTYVFGVFRLEGNNMYPALRDGDLCVTYKLEDYHSEDVVAYELDGRVVFGRIAAKPGDTVDGDEQGLIVNGAHPSEEIFYTTQILDTSLVLPLTLGEGEYLVLNDYRTDLGDSRTYGAVTEDAFRGKVIFIFRRRGF